MKQKMRQKWKSKVKRAAPHAHETYIYDNVIKKRKEIYRK